MSYNLTVIANNATSLLGLAQGVNNELMFGWFGVLILIALAAVIFMAFMTSTNDVKKSFAGDGFITFGLALFLRMLGLIDNLSIFIALICCAAAIGFSFIGEK